MPSATWSAKWCARSAACSATDALPPSTPSSFHADGHIALDVDREWGGHNERPGMSHSDGSSRPRPRLHRQRLPQRLGAAHEACVQRAALDIAAPRETGSVSATPPAPFGQFAATKALAASISGRDVSADAV